MHTNKFGRTLSNPVLTRYCIHSITTWLINSLVMQTIETNLPLDLEEIINRFPQVCFLNISACRVTGACKLFFDKPLINISMQKLNITDSLSVGYATDTVKLS